MSFGMNIWGADGALQLDQNSFTMRVVFSTVVNRTQFGNVKATVDYSVPGVNTANAIAVLIPVNGNYNVTTTQFESEVLTDVVRIYNYIRGYAGTNISTVDSMRLLVIRFS